MPYFVEEAQSGFYFGIPLYYFHPWVGWVCHWRLYVYMLTSDLTLQPPWDYVICAVYKYMINTYYLRSKHLQIKKNENWLSIVKTLGQLLKDSLDGVSNKIPFTKLQKLQNFVNNYV